MFERKGYVYRFVDEKDCVLYVGKTVNMERRMKQHFSKKSHLYKNGKGDLYKKACKIEYITCKDEFTALQKELLYINLFKPKYNTDAKIKQIVSSSDANDKWKVYKVIREVSKEQEIQNRRVAMLMPVLMYVMFILIIISFIKH